MVQQDLALEIEHDPSCTSSNFLSVDLFHVCLQVSLDNMTDFASIWLLLKLLSCWTTLVINIFYPIVD